MRYIAEQTLVPVPMIYASNPVGAEYMIMQKISCYSMSHNCCWFIVLKVTGRPAFDIWCDISLLMKWSYRLLGASWVFSSFDSHWRDPYVYPLMKHTQLVQSWALNTLNSLTAGLWILMPMYNINCINFEGHSLTLLTNCPVPWRQTYSLCHRGLRHLHHVLEDSTHGIRYSPWRLYMRLSNCARSILAVDLSLGESP